MRVYGFSNRNDETGPSESCGTREWAFAAPAGDCVAGIEAFLNPHISQKLGNMGHPSELAVAEGNRHTVGNIR